jgi:hypothetical protein
VPGRAPVKAVEGWSRTSNVTATARASTPLSAKRGLLDKLAMTLDKLAMTVDKLAMTLHEFAMTSLAMTELRELERYQTDDGEEVEAGVGDHRGGERAGAIVHPAQDHAAAGKREQRGR